MPAKRRASKARVTAPAEVWHCVFTHGFDFLGDLREWGLVEPILAHPLPGPEREAAAKAWMAAAKAAWRVHGRSFLASWRPSGFRERPWAEERFGEPE